MGHGASRVAREQKNHGWIEGQRERVTSTAVRQTVRWLLFVLSRSLHAAEVSRLRRFLFVLSTLVLLWRDKLHCGLNSPPLGQQFFSRSLIIPKSIYSYFVPKKRACRPVRRDQCAPNCASERASERAVVYGRKPQEKLAGCPIRRYEYQCNNAKLYTRASGGM